jgi:hypothetical protein|tara:strand:+ start:189 stop:380 length:192 start_codon:yes stop_codon:yes gene_type:complete
MIQIKTSIVSKIVNSKKDFFFYDIDENNKVTNYILTNDFKRKKEFAAFRVISTVQKENEFITI